MYNQIPVEDLSPNQMRNLISGRGVRVKHSAQGKHIINMSNEQVKKLSRAHKMGRGITIVLDPYQQDQHKEIFGKGIFGKKFDNFVVKTIGQQKKDKLYNVLNKVGKPVLKAGLAGLSVVGQAYGVPGKVTGALRSVANDYIDNPGKFQSMKENELIDTMATSATKGMKLGAGVKRGRPKKAKTTKAKAPKAIQFHSSGGALYPAGYMANTRRGGALYPAGF